MYDIHVVDLRHSRDSQGRTRMRLIADTVPDSNQAEQLGLSACLEALEEAGAFDIAYGHVTSSPSFPNTENVAKFVLSLGAPFDDMARYWILDQDTGAFVEHSATPESLARLIRSRTGVEACAGVAHAAQALASVARSGSSSFPAIQAALCFLASLDAEHWRNPPMLFEVRDGVGVGWKHTARTVVSGATRSAGRYSVVITGQRAVFLRTRNSASTADKAEIALDTATAGQIMAFHQTGLLPSEARAAAEAINPAVVNPEPPAATLADPPDASASTTTHTPQLPTDSRLIASWDTTTGAIAVITLTGQVVANGVSAPDRETAEAVIDAAGFTRRGEWEATLAAPHQLRVAVLQGTA
ncbi:hypothetical protein [Mycolicibacterium aubagnense]|nr:hypothetical protein [Mycolicibacterium aubagnense]TLH64269.1 hypothetical protein C1S80_12720 [Mycolicibacterium aubagnense]